MKVGVVGLGYVGLPLDVVFAEEGHGVVGLDADPRKVGALAEHSSYVEDVPSERLAALVLEFRGVTRDIEATTWFGSSGAAEARRQMALTFGRVATTTRRWRLLAASGVLATPTVPRRWVTAAFRPKRLFRLVRAPVGD
jgi:UDP-glucose 6-dehydrogenase